MPNDKDHKSILILEDQPLVRAGMKLLLHLAEPECRIFEAGSFDEAMAHLGTIEFDFAFVDIDLRSQKTGLDVLAHLREQHVATRVIMLSANDDRDIIMDCIAALPRPVYAVI